MTEFDTQRRLKYTGEIRDKIAELRKAGLSIRRIAREVGIPAGSVHYVLRGLHMVEVGATKVSNDYMTRGEAYEEYDISSSQFDYYVSRYPDKVLRANSRVYIVKEFILDRVNNQSGNAKLSDEIIIKIQDLTLETNESLRSIARVCGVDLATVRKYSLRSLNDRSTDSI